MRHSVSITRATLFIATFGCLAACPPSRVNPVTNRPQQRRYERLALGFLTSPPAVVFVEIRDGTPPLIRLHRTDELQESDLVEVDGILKDVVTDESRPREELLQRLKASSLGGRLEAQGIQWAKPSASPPTTSLGTLDRRGAAILARADDATSVTLATLGDSLLPDTDFWLTSPDGKVVALEMTYNGSPRVRDLRVFSTDRIDAELAMLRAGQAFERNANSEAKERLDFAAARLLTGDPLIGALAFNRARLAARIGDVDACVAALTQATSLDSRYRDQAVKHPDFDTVRKDGRFIGFLALAPP